MNSDVINCLVLWEAMRKKEMLFIFVCGFGGEECVTMNWVLHLYLENLWMRRI